MTKKTWGGSHLTAQVDFPSYILCNNILNILTLGADVQKLTAHILSKT